MAARVRKRVEGGDAIIDLMKQEDSSGIRQLGMLGSGIGCGRNRVGVGEQFGKDLGCAPTDRPRFRWVFQVVLLSN